MGAGGLEAGAGAGEPGAEAADGVEVRLGAGLDDEEGAAGDEPGLFEEAILLARGEVVEGVGNENEVVRGREGQFAEVGLDPCGVREAEVPRDVAPGGVWFDESQGGGLESVGGSAGGGAGSGSKDEDGFGGEGKLLEAGGDGSVDWGDSGNGEGDPYGFVINAWGEARVAGGGEGGGGAG